VYGVFKEGQIVYIGQTVMSLAERRGSHFSNARKGRGSVFGAAIRKHGEDAFAFVVLEECDSVFSLDKAEKEWIAKVKPKYNMQAGGKKSFEPWNKGKKELRPKVLQKISAAAKTRKRTKRGSYSEEHRAKIGLKTKERSKAKFICEQTQEVFENQIDAAKKLGINPKSLAVLLSGKTRLKSLKGYTFKKL
jgi:group I intron endonuclease